MVAFSTSIGVSSGSNPYRSPGSSWEVSPSEIRSVPGLGQHSYSLDLEIPRVPGNALLKVTAGSTLSRRRVSIAER